MATFAERLRKLRKEKDLTVEQLSTHIGVAKSTISRYENGREPKGDIIKLLTEYFNVSIDYLMGLSDVRTSQTDKPKEITNSQIETIAAHMENKSKNKDISVKKMKMIMDYIDLLFEEE